MIQSPGYLAHWYYHLPDLMLAALIWLLVARFVLDLLPGRGSDNLLVRVAVRATDPILRGVGYITPRVVPPCSPSPVRRRGCWRRALPSSLPCRRGACGSRWATSGMHGPGRLHTLLRRDVPLAATVAIAVVNGMPLTSLYDSVSYVLYLFTRGSAFIDQDALEYVTSLAIAIMTLLLGAIPAALYERLRGLKESTPVSLGIWLVATGIIALPSLASLLDRW